MGRAAGFSNQGCYAVAMGLFAGFVNQGSSAVAVGDSAGGSNQGDDAIAVGFIAGAENQGSYAIAIGRQAGKCNQGCYSIAISSYDVDFSQELTQIPPKSIVLNATNQDFSSPLHSQATYIKPIRETEEIDNLYDLKYNQETGEITSYKNNTEKTVIKIIANIIKHLDPSLEKIPISNHDKSLLLKYI